MQRGSRAGAFVQLCRSASVALHELPAVFETIAALVARAEPRGPTRQAVQWIVQPGLHLEQKALLRRQGGGLRLP